MNNIHIDNRADRFISIIADDSRVVVDVDSVVAVDSSNKQE